MSQKPRVSCHLNNQAMTNLDSILKSRDITLLTKVHLVKAMGFPVVMYGCNNWTIKKAEPWSTDAFELWLEKTVESPLDCKEIKPVNPKGNQSWIFIGRTDAEAEVPILGHLRWRTDSLEKTLFWERLRARGEGGNKDEMVGWHHRLNGHEFEQTLGVCDGQGRLVCCSPWGLSESNTTELLNWTALPRLGKRSFQMLFVQINSLSLSFCCLLLGPCNVSVSILHAFPAVP